jgi:DNA-binding NarL/FixJ family response regulator
MYNVSSDAEVEEHCVLMADCLIAIINEANLIRESLRYAFSARGAKVAAMPNVGAWREFAKENAAVRDGCSIVLLCIGAAEVSDETVPKAVTEALADPATFAVVIMGDINSTEQVIGAIRCGAKGYVPTSTPLEIALEALNLVRVGGTFVPAATLLPSLEERMSDQASEADQPASLFTERQLAVVQALRQGKANKVIAYELNMCESTVKVHVRAIMRKLKASNRTEVAYRTQALFAGQPLVSRS